MSSTASALEGDVTGKVLKLLVDDTDYSQCMAFLNVAKPVVACNGSWVAIGCDGSFGSKSNAQQRLARCKLLT